MGLEVGTASVVEALRARTRALHEQIEANVDLAAALRSRAAYRRMLQGYLRLYRAFEARVGDVARVALLEKDLRVLGVDEDEIAAVPMSADFPLLDGLDERMGARYVVEGSQLGGQYIYRQIQEKLGLDAESGAAFFYGAGEGTGRAWKAFLAELEVSVASPERAVAAAEAMFHVFGSELKRATAVPAAEGR